MKNYIFICLMFSFCLFSSCSEDKEFSANNREISEIMINANVSGIQTRAATDTVDARVAFNEGEKLVLTTVRRTINPLAAYSYSDVGYTRNASQGWNRDGSSKIYWTDATDHTFVGYSLPTLESGTFDFTKDINGILYSGTLGTDQSSFDKYVAEDLLLSFSDIVKYNSDLAAADLKFCHALSKVRVILSINGFAASSTSTDVKTTLNSIQLGGQPVEYVWNQQNVSTTVKTGAVADQMINMWKAKEYGTNNNKRFYTYALVVPGTRSFDVNMSVTYPDVKSATEGATKTETYKASFNNILLTSGMMTTLNITLNHENGGIIVGSTFTDWSDTSTSDNADMNEESLFLSSTDTGNITLGKNATSAGGASWLYTDNAILKDKYGHSGDSSADAYEVRYASDLLAFAAEVNSGNTFSSKYVKLASSLYMQQNVKYSTLSWIGIGNESYSFNGTFDGNRQTLFLFKGSPLFYVLGNDAKVSNLTVMNKNWNLTTTAATSVDANTAGIICGINKGRIEGCAAYGKVIGTTVAGGISGSNEGTILASYHQGNIQASSATAGGIVGTNTGTIQACYHAGGNVTGATVGGVVATNTGTISYCYYDTSYSSTIKSISGTDDTETVKGLVLNSMQGQTLVEYLNNGITDWNQKNTENVIAVKFVYNSGNYPLIKH